MESACAGNFLEDAEVCPTGVEGADEVADFRVADLVRVRVAFGLDVDVAQSEGVLPDDAVDSVVAGLAHALLSAVGSAVSHGPQQVHDRSFEERRVSVLQSPAQVGFGLGVEGAFGVEHGFDRFDDAVATLRRDVRCVFAGFDLLLVGAPFGPLEHVSFGVGGEPTTGDGADIVGDAVVAAPGTLDERGLDEGRQRPVDAVGVSWLARRDELGEDLIGETHVLSDELDDLGYGALLAVCQDAEGGGPELGDGGCQVGAGRGVGGHGNPR